MSALCSSCGVSLPAGAAACPGCGARAPALVLPLPPEETCPLPVSYASVQPRSFGVAPAAPPVHARRSRGACRDPALRTWAPGPRGLILLGHALLSVAAFAEAAKPMPDSQFARRAHAALPTARQRAGVAVGLCCRARPRAAQVHPGTPRALSRLHGLGGATATELGETVLVEDAAAAGRLMEQIEGRDALAAEKELGCRRSPSARRRIRNARMSVAQTTIVAAGSHDQEGVEQPEAGLR